MERINVKMKRDEKINQKRRGPVACCSLGVSFLFLYVKYRLVVPA